MTETLFPEELPAPEESRPDAPLAERLRPRNLGEVLGQEHLLKEGMLLREIAGSDTLPSLILWGPPGVGKTTLAGILARDSGCHFVAISAVMAGVKEVRGIIEEAKRLRRSGRRTALFVDEIHRFNKAQQDAFLSHVESGLLTLIGATTENPSFEVISPLLSRTRVVTLNPLSEEDLMTLIRRALQDRDRGLGRWGLQMDEDLARQIAISADGDARKALTALEIAAQLARGRSAKAPVVSREMVRQALQKRMLRYDKAGEEHFNVISALHKSLRNSDADAALYWLARMLEAGESPLYVARRLVRFASEDIGTADMSALGHAVDSMRAVHFIGLPEGKLALAQLVIYLAQAPKSNAVDRAYGRVLRDVEATRNDPVPLHLRNAPTRLMKELGYGAGYRHPHDEPDAVSPMECLPEGLRNRRYYQPSGRGAEPEIGRRLEEIRRKKSAGGPKPPDGD